MGKSQESFRKKEVKSKKDKKRQEKEKKKQARKDNKGSSSFDDMIAYVDENGNITSEPPEANQEDDFELDDIEVSIPKTSSTEKNDPIRHGILDFYNDSKGYGFIRDKDSRESLFVHINNMIDDIREGDKVSFEREMGMKGPVAIKVKLDKQ